MYLFVDTETNGIPRNPDAAAADVNNWPRLVQIAWTLTDEYGGELRAQTFIVRPDGFKVSKRVERSRGITTATALRLGVGIEDALEAHARDATSAEAVVGHNLQYDQRVIQAEFHRAGHRIDPFAGKKLYCTMRSSTTLCRIPGGPSGYKWPKLEELHRALFGFEFERAHDATADVRACAKCFFELKRRGVMDDRALFDEIYRLADSIAWFDTSRFVDDVHARFENQGITAEQRAALTRIRDMLAKKSSTISSQRNRYNPARQTEA